MKRNQILDQAAHFFLGPLCVAPALFDQFWACPVLMGLAREVEQMVNKGDWDWGWGRSVDMIFWALGGVVLQVASCFI